MLYPDVELWSNASTDRVPTCTSLPHYLSLCVYVFLFPPPSLPSFLPFSLSVSPPSLPPFLPFSLSPSHYLYLFSFLALFFSLSLSIFLLFLPSFLSTFLPFSLFFYPFFSPFLPHFLPLFSSHLHNRQSQKTFLAREYVSFTLYTIKQCFQELKLILSPIADHQSPCSTQQSMERCTTKAHLWESSSSSTTYSTRYNHHTNCSTRGTKSFKALFASWYHKFYSIVIKEVRLCSSDLNPPIFV